MDRSAELQPVADVLLADPEVRLVDRGSDSGGWILLETGEAVIAVVRRGTEERLSIRPRWGHGLDYLTTANGLRTYLNQRVESASGDLVGEARFVLSHLETVRQICSSEAAWQEFCSRLPTGRHHPVRRRVRARHPSADYVAILESFPGVDIVSLPEVRDGHAVATYGHVSIEVGPMHLRFWPSAFGTEKEASTIEEFAIATDARDALGGTDLFSELEFIAGRLDAIEATCVSRGAWQAFRGQVQAAR